MDYMDEKLQGIRNQFRKNEDKDIYGDVYIGEEKFEFKDVAFFDGKMSMRIPKTFEDMPLAVAKFKYPSEQRPQIIKTNKDGSVNLTLSLFNEELKKENIGQVKDGLKIVLERLNPAYVFFENKIEEKDGLTVGYFQFKSSALDSDLYSLMFITPIESKFLLGTFNCKLEEKEEWGIVFQQIMMSIKDLTLEKEDA